MGAFAGAFSTRPRNDQRDWRWAYILLAILAAAGPSLLWPGMEIAGTRPELLTLLVVWHGLHGSPRGRYLPALLVGLVRDLFSSGPFGAYAIIYAVLHRMLGSTRHLVRRDSPIIQVLVAASAVLGVVLASHGVLVLQGEGTGWLAAGRVAGWSALVTAPLLPLLHWLLVLGLARLGAERDSADNWPV